MTGGGVFRPIAMLCSAKDFEEIKPILETNNIHIIHISKFIKGDYLTNNLDNKNNNVSNIASFLKNDNNRAVFEKWNKDIFLEYCGIKIDSETWWWN
jgi:hypothetical protein